MIETFGPVTIERLIKAKRIDDIADNYSYSKGLLFAYIQTEMRRLKSGKEIDYDNLRTALSIFGISLCNKYTANGEKCAVLDRENFVVEFYINDKNAESGRIYYSIGIDGAVIAERKVKQRKRRPFSELSPELKKKIKERNGWS